MAYNVRMQITNGQQIINKPVAKFDKVMIRFYFLNIVRIGLFSSSTISKVLDIFSLGRQVYLHTSMIDEYIFIHNCA